MVARGLRRSLTTWDDADSVRTPDPDQTEETVSSATYDIISDDELDAIVGGGPQIPEVVIMVKAALIH